MDLTNQRILVTGGGGFVGSHLADRLARNENKVLVVDDFSAGNQMWVENQVETTKADLTDSTAVSKIVDSDFDAIFHLASKKKVNSDDPYEQFRDNTEMTHNILRAAHECDITNMVYTSSSTVYAEAPQPTPEGYR